MKIVIERVGTLVTIPAFAATVAGPTMTHVDTPNKTPVEIKLHVSEKDSSKIKMALYGKKRIEHSQRHACHDHVCLR